MAGESELSRVQNPLRWGIFLTLFAAVVISEIPNLASGFAVAVGEEQTRVASFSAWTIPAMDVTFSMPPMQGDEGSLNGWIAEQFANGIYAVAVLIYFGAAAAFVTGLSQIGLAVYRFYKSADALKR